MLGACFGVAVPFVTPEAVIVTFFTAVVVAGLVVVGLVVVVVGLVVATVDRGRGAFFTGEDVVPAAGVDLGTTLRGDVVVEVAARLTVDEDGTVAFTAVDDEAEAVPAVARRALDAAVGADSLLADAEPPVCCGLSVGGGGLATEGRVGFAAAEPVALERVEGREEGGGLVVLDEVAILDVVEDGAALGFAADDELALEIVFVTLVDFSATAFFGVVGSFGVATCGVSTTATGSSVGTFSSVILGGSCDSFSAAALGSGSLVSGAGGTVA